MSQTKNLEQHWTPAPHGWEPHTTPGAAKIFVSGHQKYLCFPRISSSVAEGVKWGLFVCGGCPSAAGWWRCVLLVEEGSMHLGPVRLGSSRARHCPACRHCLARPQGRHQPTTLYANTSVNSQHCSFHTGNNLGTNKAGLLDRIQVKLNN